ncbi:peptidase S1 [Actinophytocola xinjiangensis]|uniref:Peptidase S1 n=1 Tax=Actinophytocola xinjiangensis TaxID=485602 RepID=A0A7Z0WQ49_9PSEU|nr:trypsin-like peptidase domain-containing protein [Actinophytocola xinjiangensis]OLF12856.1 peptidase S1 [Actinophytocola xinjiangensis]
MTSYEPPQPHQPPCEQPPPWWSAQQPPHQPARSRRLSRNVVVVVAAAVLAGGGVGGVVGATLGGGDTTATPTTATATTANAPTDVSSVVAKVQNSVVQISGRTAGGEVIGSGVIVSGDGRILTNNHVVAGAGELTVTLSDGRTAGATVLDTAPTSDLAVIQVHGLSGLTAAELGNSDDVRVGDEVIAIGSPDGLQGTVTTGIVSAVDREVQVPAGHGQNNRVSDQSVSYRAIQTDASINQGNSGGPLFDANGRVIGINSAMYSPVVGADGSAGSVGIGFAIPSNDAQQVLDQS